MRILLTGGGGMVGQNILEHESASEHEILAPPRSELDLLDRSKIDAYLENFSPDFVIHAAGRVGGIRANIASPLEFLVENLNMALNLFESAPRNRDSATYQSCKLVHVSEVCDKPFTRGNALKW